VIYTLDNAASKRALQLFVHKIRNPTLIAGDRGSDCDTARTAWRNQHGTLGDVAHGKASNRRSSWCRQSVLYERLAPDSKRAVETLRSRSDGLVRTGYRTNDASKSRDFPKSNCRRVFQLCAQGSWDLVYLTYATSNAEAAHVSPHSRYSPSVLLPSLVLVLMLQL
jgi:hypothetical protein